MVLLASLNHYLGHPLPFCLVFEWKHSKLRKLRLIYFFILVAMQKGLHDFKGHKIVCNYFNIKHLLYGNILIQ